MMPALVAEWAAVDCTMDWDSTEKDGQKCPIWSGNEKEKEGQGNRHLGGQLGDQSQCG